MALERGMSYFTTAKIINMAVIITMAMARQRAKTTKRGAEPRWQSTLRFGVPRCFAN
jgi:hypothetical protein